MYHVGQMIVYGGEGVCRVERVGPLSMQGARQDVEYYTLSPLYREGKIFTPVDTQVRARPVMSRQEALDLIARIPQIPAQVYENNNPRLLTEHYQTFLKSDDCMDLLRLIRSIYAKGRSAARRGRHLGQVDERSMKRAQEILHGELAAALDIPLEEVPDYIRRSVEGLEKEQEKGRN